MLMLTALIWGTAFVAQSVGMDFVGPLTFNFARFLVGGLVLVPCMAILKKCGIADGSALSAGAKAERRRYGIRGGVRCGILLFLASTAQQYGILYTSVGKAGFITALYIIIVPLLGVFMKRRVPRLIWISALIALCGMYLLCMKGGGGFSRGDFLVFLCAVLFSFHIMNVDYFSPRTDGVFMSCVQFFTAGAVSGVLAFLLEHPVFDDILGGAAPILYAGVLSCGVAYTLQILGQKRVRPAVASLIMSLESVFSALAGWVVLNQKLSPKELLGCALVFAAILLAQRA